MAKFIGILILLGIIGAVMQEQDEKSGGSSNSGGNSTISTKTEKPTKPSIPISDQQKEFIKIIKTFKGDYEKASNELKQSAVRVKRKKALAELFGNNLSVQFIGKIASLSTTTEQNAYVEIKLLSTNIITISNLNNELSDMDIGSLIKQGSSMYDTVADLDEGGKVKFSGTLLLGDADIGQADDYISEQSITEGGSMEDPHFHIKFSSIEKIG